MLDEGNPGVIYILRHIRVKVRFLLRKTRNEQRKSVFRLSFKCRHENYTGQNAFGSE